MADIRKAIKPVESTRIAPLNDGSVYQANKEIIFRLGAGLDMFLVNKSYLSFNIVRKAKEIEVFGTDQTAGTQMNYQPSYIRNAGNLFKTVEATYGSDVLYTTKTYNIEQNTINQSKMGDDYLDANWATFTTTNMILRDKTAYLKLDNNGTVKNAGTAEIPVDSQILSIPEQTITNVQVPLNQLLPPWMDLGTEGFPMRSLNQQIELRLYIADPYQYIVDWDNTNGIQDFTTKLDAPQAIEGTSAWNKNGKIEDRFEASDITLDSVFIYANYYTPEATEAAIIDEKCRSGSYKLNYNIWNFDERQVSGIKTTENIPFSVVSSNTKSMLVYAFRRHRSPSVMYRPNISNLQLKFTPHVAPMQPISESTMSAPHEYKYQIDDVLDNIDTYHSSTNTDYNRCYLAETSDPLGSAVTKPSSNFFIFGMNYVSDPTDLGGDSSDWNSQYQLNFNGKSGDRTELQYVLAVNVECGLIIKDNKIFTFTL